MKYDKKACKSSKNFRLSKRFRAIIFVHIQTNSLFTNILAINSIRLTSEQLKRAKNKQTEDARRHYNLQQRNTHRKKKKYPQQKKKKRRNTLKQTNFSILRQQNCHASTKNPAKNSNKNDIICILFLHIYT